jgi:hypothetical protein
MLAIDVIPEPEKVVSEMRRATRSGGVVACGACDFWGGVAAEQMTGPNRSAQRIKAMPADRRDEIQRLTKLAYLAGSSDGPRSFAAIIRAVRGVVP